MVAKRTRRVQSILFVLALTCAGVAGRAVRAAPLPPGVTLQPVPGEADPSGFTAVTAPLVGSFSGPGSITGAVLSRVWFGDASNPYGGLTFSYAIQNNAASADAIARLELSGFGGLLVDASYQTPVPTGLVIPVFADRRITGTGPGEGDVVRFAFTAGDGGPTGVPPGQSSALLVLQTNATEFHASIAAQLNDGAASALVYIPIPEPTTLGLISLASLLMLRRRRADR